MHFLQSLSLQSELCVSRLFAEMCPAGRLSDKQDTFPLETGASWLRDSGLSSSSRKLFLLLDFVLTYFI